MSAIETSDIVAFGNVNEHEVLPSPIFHSIRDAVSEIADGSTLHYCVESGIIFISYVSYGNETRI